MEDDHRGGRDRARIGAIGRAEGEKGRRKQKAGAIGRGKGEKSPNRPIAAVGNAGF